MSPLPKTPLSLLTFLSLGGLAAAQTPTVIYCEVATAPNSIVPGALDAGGMPVVSNWLSVVDLAVRQDGGEWCVKGTTDLGTTLDQILVLGSGTVGNAFMQDGQPVQGGAMGELYDFFDSPTPVTWNTAGDIALTFRAKGGVAGTLEKIAKVVGGVHTIVLQQGDAVTGITDEGANPSGDEQMGNSASGVRFLDSGSIGWFVTPIQNCSSFRYPGLFVDNAVFRYCRASAIGGEVWDSFDLGDHGGTPDGLHWFAQGDTENANTAIDDILAVDDVIVLQEGSPVVGGGPVMSDVFFTRMLPNGTWLTRGDDPASDDWAVRDGVLLAKTGDAIGVTGENWGNAFSALNGNTSGDWVMTGNTNNPDTTIDTVLVLNGTTVLAREGDPIDVDGNGMFDDDAFLNTFQPDDLFLTEDGVVWLLVSLRNGAGTGIGDAFLKIGEGEPGTGYCAGDGIDPDVTTPCGALGTMGPCLNSGAPGHGCASSFNAMGALIGASGTVNGDDVVLEGSGMNATGFCIFLKGDMDAPAGIPFGDGVRCADGTLIRLRSVALSAGAAEFPNSSETVTLSQRGQTPVGSGLTGYYTVYYRNAAAAFCPPQTFNAANGYQIDW